MNKKLTLLFLPTLLQLSCTQAFGADAQIKSGPTGAAGGGSNSMASPANPANLSNPSNTANPSNPSNAGNPTNPNSPGSAANLSNLIKSNSQSNPIDQSNALNPLNNNINTNPNTSINASGAGSNNTGGAPTDSMPPLRGLQSSAAMSEKSGGANATGTGASVDSYFMTGPNRNGRGPQMQPQMVVYGPNPNEGQKKHGFVWHFLDNIGVPMFGNNDLEIDPSIKTVYVIPPPKLPSEKQMIKSRNQSAASGNATTTTVKAQEASQNAQPTQQKIPESELEGTIYESPASKEMPAPAQ